MECTSHHIESRKLITGRDDLGGYTESYQHLKFKFD